MLLTHKYTMYSPRTAKSEADVGRIIRRLRDLRPIALLRTPAKLVAVVANTCCSSGTGGCVSGQQGGLVGGRLLCDSRQVEGASVEYTQVADCLSVAFLLCPLRRSLFAMWVDLLV